MASSGKQVTEIATVALIVGLLGFIFLSIIFQVGGPVVKNTTYIADFPGAVQVLTYLPEIIGVILLVVVLAIVYKVME